MNKFLLLCVIVSMYSLVNAIDNSSILGNLVSNTCVTIPTNSNAANNVLIKLDNFLKQSGIRSQYQSLAAYVADISNRQQLSGDIGLCQKFFNGVENAATSDLVKNGRTVADVEAILYQILSNN